MKTSSREDFISGLRAMADFLEMNPDFYVPPKKKTIRFATTGKASAEDIGKHAKMLGKCQKLQGRNTIGLRRKFGPITLQMEWEHYQVCKRVEVGKREVTHYQYWNAPVVKQIETEYKWVCPKSFVEACCE